MLEGVAPSRSCAASSAGIITSQDLDLYRQAKALRNEAVVRQVKVNIVERRSRLTPSDAAVLPPVWSARTSWQLDMAIAQAQKELLSCR